MSLSEDAKLTLQFMQKSVQEHHSDTGHFYCVLPQDAEGLELEPPHVRELIDAGYFTRTDHIGSYRLTDKAVNEAST